ncbi:MAG: hypothetical protein NDI77_11625, partial [Geobacteraceae bacterium]|nr:hypothetical protein [Geobacteraceae bacterium]
LQRGDSVDDIVKMAAIAVVDAQNKVPSLVVDLKERIKQPSEQPIAVEPAKAWRPEAAASAAD